MNIYPWLNYFMSSLFLSNQVMRKILFMLKYKSATSSTQNACHAYHMCVMMILYYYDKCSCPPSGVGINQKLLSETLLTGSVKCHFNCCRSIRNLEACPWRTENQNISNYQRVRSLEVRLMIHRRIVLADHHFVF